MSATTTTPDNKFVVVFCPRRNETKDAEVATTITYKETSYFCDCDVQTQSEVGAAQRCKQACS